MKKHLFWKSQVTESLKSGTRISAICGYSKVIDPNGPDTASLIVCKRCDRIADAKYPDAWRWETSSAASGRMSYRHSGVSADGTGVYSIEIHDYDGNRYDY